MKTFALRLALLLAFTLPVVALGQEPAPAAQPSIMGLVLQGLVGLAGVALTVLLSVAAMAIGKRTKDSRFGAVINQLWVIVQSAVAHAEAEIRPKLQKALEDGKLSAEEAAALKADVVKIVKETAASQLSELVKTFGIPEGVLSNMISGLVERAVAVLKTSPAPTPSPTIPSAAPTPPVNPR